MLLRLDIDANDAGLYVYQEFCRNQYHFIHTVTFILQVAC